STCPRSESASSPSGCVKAGLADSAGREGRLLFRFAGGSLLSPAPAISEVPAHIEREHEAPAPVDGLEVLEPPSHRADANDDRQSTGPTRVLATTVQPRGDRGFYVDVVGVPVDGAPLAPANGADIVFVANR